MSNPHTEEAYERYEDNKTEIFERYLEQDNLTNVELVEFMMNDAELYSLFMDKWIEANDEKLREYFMSNLPDGNEDCDECDGTGKKT